MHTAGLLLHPAAVANSTVQVHDGVDVVVSAVIYVHHKLYCSHTTILCDRYLHVYRATIAAGSTNLY
jgi:hypothetical protein